MAMTPNKNGNYKMQNALIIDQATQVTTQESNLVDMTETPLVNGPDKLVTNYNHNLSVDENLANAGLLFEVNRARSAYQFGDKILESDYDSLIRSDNGRELGIIRTDEQSRGKARTWNPVNNISLAEYTLEIANRYGLTMTRMINFKGGERVAFELSTDTFNVYGHEHAQGITILNGHTGKNSFQAVASLTDLICDNGQWWIDMSDKIARITHNGGHAIAKANSESVDRAIIERLEEQRNAYIEAMKALESRKMAKTDAAKLLAMVYGIPKLTKEGDCINMKSVAAQAYAAYLFGPAQGDYDDSALKVFNGLTAYETHNAGRDSNIELRLENKLTGNKNTGKFVQLISDIQTNRNKSRDQFQALEIPEIQMWDEAAQDIAA